MDGRFCVERWVATKEWRSLKLRWTMTRLGADLSARRLSR